MRAVVNAGWSDISGKAGELNSPIYTIKYTDLEWLFPQCNTIVHHGGVGTTHISVESGVPTVICSIFADNPLWGERLKSLNIGRHIKYKDLTKAKLITAIKELQDEKVRARAREFGKKVKAEQGLERALDFIELNLSSAPVYRQTM